MVTRGPQAAVLVIDDSFASGYLARRQAVAAPRDATKRAGSSRSSGPRPRSRSCARREGADHPTELTRDHLRLRDQLLALEPIVAPRRYHARADARRPAARRVEHARKTVFLISLRREDRLPRRRAAVGQGRPDARAARSAPAEAAEPRGDALRVDADPGAGSRGVAFDAEVGNFSDTPAKVELQLAIGDRVVARGSLDVAAGGHATKRFLAMLPAGRASDRRLGLARRRRPRRSTIAAGCARRCATRSACCSSTAIRTPSATTTSCSTSRPRCARAIARTAARRCARSPPRSSPASIRSTAAGAPPRHRRSISRTSMSSCSRTSPRCRPSASTVLARLGARRRRHPHRARRSRRPGRLRPHDAAADAAERCAIRSTPRGARRPTSATAARSTS